MYLIRVLREVKLEAKALHNYSEEDLLSSGSDSDDGKLHVQGAKSLQNGSTSSQIKDMLIQHQRRLAANVVKLLCTKMMFSAFSFLLVVFD